MVPRLGVIFAGAAVALVACGGAASDTVDDVSADAAAVADGQVADLRSTLREGGFESIASALDTIDFEAIAGTPDFTFFAPDDQAFRDLDADQLADLLSDPARLTDVVRDHTIASVVAVSDLASVTEVEAVSGRMLAVETIDGVTSVGGATVVGPDIAVGRGVVHVIDRLILR